MSDVRNKNLQSLEYMLGSNCSFILPAANFIGLRGNKIYKLCKALKPKILTIMIISI